VPEIEVLVVDDCSSDSTRAVVEEMAGTDPRVRLFSTGVNGGPAVARNVALNNARGDWVVLLDADDEFLPQHLSALVSLGSNTAADMVASNVLVRGPGGSASERVIIPPELLCGPRRTSFSEFMEHSLGQRGVARGVSWVGLKPAYRRRFLEHHRLRFDERLRWGEDYAMLARCLARGASFWLAAEPTYVHAVRPDSLTDNPRPADLWLVAELDRELLQQPSVSDDPRLRRAFDRHYEVHARWFHYQCFSDALRAGEVGKAVSVMFRSFDSAHQILRAIAANTVLDATSAVRRLRQTYPG